MIRFAVRHMEIALSNPVPTATYACEYLAVAKSAAFTLIPYKRSFAYPNHMTRQALIDKHK